MSPERVDISDIDLTSISVPLDGTLPLFSKWNVRGGVIVNGKRWLEVLKGCNWFDCVTFSANWKAATKCKHLLACRVWGNFPSTCEVRLASNVHTKLYIIRQDWGETEVWVGSHNLTLADSWHNVMVQVNEEQAKTLKIYFKRIWNLAKVNTI